MSAASCYATVPIGRTIDIADYASRMITVTEGSTGGDKASYGLAIFVTLGEDESLESDFYKIRNALLSWKRSRNDACGALSIEYQIAESNRQQVESFWITKVENDELIRLVFGSISEVELSLITPDRRNIKKIGFELRAP